MKKILILTHNTKENSGWGRYSGELIKALIKAKQYELEVLTEQENKQSFDFEKNILLPSSSTLNVIRNILRIRDKTKDFDIIHAFDGWPYAIYGYFGILGTKKRLFSNGVGTYSVAPLKTLIKGFLLRRAYKKADQIFCISRYVVGEIKKLMPEAKVSIAHMGLNIMSNPTEENWKNFNSKFQLKKGKLNILTVGAIKNRKGQLDTVKAVHSLKNKYSDIQYWIVGRPDDSKYTQKILNYIKDNKLTENVRIFSNVDNDIELACFYNTASVFALNSRNEGNHFEGFGLVIIEAGQFGMPAVGSTNNGIEDAIMDGKTGFLVPQGDIGKIAKALEDSQLLKKEEVKEFAHSFSWEKNASIYSQFYNKI